VARQPGAATITAQRASVIAAVRCPLGQLAGSIWPPKSQSAWRGSASRCLSACVVAPVPINTTAVAIARSGRRRASATPMHARPSSA
jgi:hypothetical protein